VVVLGAVPARRCRSVARFLAILMKGTRQADGLVSMGQSVGLVHDVPTCKELIDRTVEEAQETQERLAGLFAKAPA
jgi:NAD(P)H-dependent flavin oxidoreductase YrpB (nitropropane dioxygenase family)